MDAKKMIFPAGYDPTKMFWLINSSGAFGARSGLPQAVREIVRGWFKGAQESQQYPAACEYSADGMSCFVPTNTMKRLAGLLSHGATFRFHG
jgi:archaellum biogenesis protein FlaJ (TadC family)